MRVRSRIQAHQHSAVARLGFRGAPIAIAHSPEIIAVWCCRKKSSVERNEMQILYAVIISKENITAPNHETKTLQRPSFILTPLCAGGKKEQILD